MEIILSASYNYEVSACTVEEGCTCYNHTYCNHDTCNRDN